jgi:putative acetyltransferase
MATTRSVRSCGPDTVRVRKVRDTDAQDLFGLITLCFADYPGCFADPHDDLADLVRPAQSAIKRGLLFLVVEDDSERVQACIGGDFPTDGTAELHRPYVRPDARCRGLASHLTGALVVAGRGAGPCAPGRVRSG